MRRNNILHQGDDDPMGSVANLFDVAMVFAVALMVALVTRLGMTEILGSEDFTMIKNPGKDNMEIITREGTEIKHYTPSEDQQQSGSKGKRVGIAYQLENGEIIYVPE
ncbi:MAG: DUF2149 domain-containing protein [Bacteroidaceae bacterium]|nr:DUF2149 domain-containing protein [Bacteroidaceae bacterium]